MKTAGLMSTRYANPASQRLIRKYAAGQAMRFATSTSLLNSRRQQPQHVPDGPAHDLADTDLLRTALRRERRKTEKAEARDRDRSREKPANTLASRCSVR